MPKKDFMDMIGGSLAKKKKTAATAAETAEPVPELYSEEELDIVENHIKEKIGDYKNVFHEIFSPDIHCDICIIDPDEERNYYTLVTLGMGAHRMNVPEDCEKYNIARAELAICLPPDWDINSSDEEYYWPIRLLKSLARFPGNCNTWLGYGHSIDNQAPYADNTELCCAVLSAIQSDKENASYCRLPNGDDVNFYQVIPIYAEERDFKIKFSADDLFDNFKDDTYIVNTRRECLVNEEISRSLWLRKNTIDSYYFHAPKISDKKLAVEEIAGANHIAIFLRWLIEHDLVNETFVSENAEVVEDVKSGAGKIDLREFLVDKFNGRLFAFILEDEGNRFTWYYYGRGKNPCYTVDIDKHAVRCFGLPRYYCNEFKDEGYLFVPYDERYYEDMAARIDKVYADFLENIEGYQRSDDFENFNDYPYTAEILAVFESYNLNSLEEIEEKSEEELKEVFAKIRPIQEEYDLSDEIISQIIHLNL